jgi:hypothetical protein
MHVQVVVRSRNPWTVINKRNSFNGFSVGSDQGPKAFETWPNTIASRLSKPVVIIMVIQTSTWLTHLVNADIIL